MRRHHNRNGRQQIKSGALARANQHMTRRILHMTKQELLEENQLLKQRLAKRDEKVARQAEVITKLEASRTALHKALQEVTERGTKGWNQD